MIPPITGKDLEFFRILKGFKTKEEFANWSGKSLSTIHRYEDLENITPAAEHFYIIKLGWNIKRMKDSLDNFLINNNLNTDDFEENLKVLEALIFLKRYWDYQGY